MSDVSELSTQRALGKLEGTVTGLDTRMTSVETQVGAIDTKLDKVLEHLAQSRGSNKTRAWFMGAIGAVIGSIVSAAVQFLKPH